MKMSRIWRVVIIILIVVVLALGYIYHADLVAVEKVEYDIQDVSIPEIGLTYCNLVFILNISNPSPHKVSSLSISFTIYLANESIGKGFVNNISIHAHSSIKKEMMVKIYYANVVSGVINAIKNGKFLLTLDGKGVASIFFGLVKASRNFKISYEYP